MKSLPSASDYLFLNCALKFTLFLVLMLEFLLISGQVLNVPGFQCVESGWNHAAYPFPSLEPKPLHLTAYSTLLLFSSRQVAQGGSNTGTFGSLTRSSEFLWVG